MSGQLEASTALPLEEPLCFLNRRKGGLIGSSVSKPEHVDCEIYFKLTNLVRFVHGLALEIRRERSVWERQWRRNLSKRKGPVAVCLLSYPITDHSCMHNSFSGISRSNPSQDIRLCEAWGLRTYHKAIQQLPT